MQLIESDGKIDGIDKSYFKTLKGISFIMVP